MCQLIRADRLAAGGVKRSRVVRELNGALRGGEGPLSGPLECREGCVSICVHVLEVEMTDLGLLVGTSASSGPNPYQSEL